MNTETWTTELGNKVELNWEVKSNDLNVWKIISVTIKGKIYKSDGETDNGTLVIKNGKTYRFNVPAEILKAIDEAYETAKANIAESVKDHDDYTYRMAQLGY